jgi:hypothetical protein
MMLATDGMAAPARTATWLRQRTPVVSRIREANGEATAIFAGPLCEHVGGARVTQWSMVGLLVCAVAVTLFTTPIAMDEFPYFVAAVLGLLLLAGVGNASMFKQMPMSFSAAAEWRDRRPDKCDGCVRSVRLRFDAWIRLRLVRLVASLLLRGRQLLPDLRRHESVVLHPHGCGNALLTPCNTDLDRRE